MRKGLKLASLFIFACMLAGCRVEVYDKLSQRDANEMTALLLNAGIDAQRVTQKDGVFAVSVSEDDFARAVMLIQRSGLPKQEFATIVDVLSDDRLIASPSEERARLNYALSQELSRTVSEIEGVVTARVHLATPSEEPLARRDSKSSASVAIHHKRTFNTGGVVPRIKVLVANAVDGLDYDNVSVALFPTNEQPTRWSEKTSIDVQNGFEDPTPSLSGAQSSKAPAVTAAGLIDGRLGPAVAAILGGGLVVLLLAGQTILSGARRKARPARVEERGDVSEARARPKRRRREP